MKPIRTPPCFQDLREKSNVPLWLGAIYKASPRPAACQPSSGGLEPA
ncbi:hypothetical protein NEIPOLOT_01812 [Neisseria polysaccharea ATCC 43768]|nr:hypothetical protein NEIPOLOT_01812 [Neisseria polysaccharea ATCC 43768]